MFASFQIAVQRFLANNLMPFEISNEIIRYLNTFVDKAKGLTVAGLGMLAVTAIMTMITIESAFNVIWRVRKLRPLAQRILVYLCVLTLGPLLFGLSLSFSSYALAKSASWSSAWSSELGGDAGHQITRLTSWILSSSALPLTILAYALLYLYLPNCRVKWRDALVGAILAGLCSVLARYGFGLYLRRFPTYATVYGAFAILPIFLVWVHLNWMITLLGGTVVSLLPEIRTGQKRTSISPDNRLPQAINLLACLQQMRAQGKAGASDAELATLCDGDRQAAQHVLERLVQKNWVARLPQERDEEARWVLVIDAKQITLDALFDEFEFVRLSVHIPAAKNT
jgi:membrane protein